MPQCFKGALALHRHLRALLQLGESGFELASSQPRHFDKIYVRPVALVEYLTPATAAPVRSPKAYSTLPIEAASILSGIARGMAGFLFRPHRGEVVRIHIRAAGARVVPRPDLIRNPTDRPQAPSNC
jgi:hypothetical protein